MGRAKEFIQKFLNQNDPMPLVPNISHGIIRFFKSVGLLYLAHLRNRRDAVAQRPRMSAQVLGVVDQRLAQLTGNLSAGVFGVATPVELMAVAEMVSATGAVIIEDRSSALPVRRPIVVSTIEILDPDLQARCLDLFEQFRVDGKMDRLDTVITEATRILEDRLRRVSRAPADCTGVDLAQFVFGASPLRLLVSQVDAEQQAVHLLFRGVFGFIRNAVHHRLVGQLQPERVLQIVGMIDYLLSVIQGAQSCQSEQ